MLSLLNPKGSKVYRKSKFPLTYDSEGVVHRSKRFSFYKHAIPSELCLSLLFSHIANICVT